VAVTFMIIQLSVRVPHETTQIQAYSTVQSLHGILHVFGSCCEFTLHYSLRYVTVMKLQ